MIRIGIIGDIGSGKSYVAKKFGYPIFNADEEVADLYKNSRKCYNKIKKTLPDYITSFPIKKSELFRAIKVNQYNLKKIVKIVHPEIKKKMNRFIKKNKKRKFIILDVPLLLENKLNRKDDILIFVDAKKKDIKKRLKKRGKENTKILKRFQLPVEFKKKRADYLIKNNFNNNILKKDVKIIINKILLND